MWVDITCIDQEHYEIKMDEIGKQAEIFRRASQAYVWLSSCQSMEFSDSLQALQGLAEQIEEAEVLEHFDEI